MPVLLSRATSLRVLDLTFATVSNTEVLVLPPGLVELHLVGASPPTPLHPTLPQPVTDTLSQRYRFPGGYGSSVMAFSPSDLRFLSAIRASKHRWVAHMVPASAGCNLRTDLPLFLPASLRQLTISQVYAILTQPNYLQVSTI